MQQNLILDLNKLTKKLLINDLFYGLFVSTIQKKESKDIPLAAVGVNKNTMEFMLLINPDEWFKFDEMIRYSVLKHEAFHLTEFHLLTSDLYPNSKMDNIGTDCNINQRIGKANLPSWGIFIEDLEKKYPQLDWKRNAGRDHYYKELNKLSEEEKQELGIDEKAQHQWIIVDGNGNQVDGDSLSQSQKDALRVQVENTIEQLAEEVMKSQGTIPSEIDQLIKGFVKPKPVFNYLKYIRNYVGNSTRYIIGKTKLRENQRFEGSPKVILKPLNKILVLIDESGSVSQTELLDFMNEIHHLSKKTDIEIRPFDTQVMNPVKYTGNGSFQRTQCGGTLFSPCVEFYEKHPEFTSCIVFTDGFAEEPPVTNKKMLWVISSNGSENVLKKHQWIKIPK